IMNWSFLLHVSCDKNFDTPIKNAPIRVSLFHVCIGISHYYIITYDFDSKKPALYFKLKYTDLCPNCTESDITKEVNNYKNTLPHTKSERHDALVDFLKEKKEDNKEAISSSYNKSSFLLGFITTIVGLLVYLLPMVVSYKSNSTFLHFVVLYLSLSSVTNIINAGVFIFEVLRVRGYLQYSYDDFLKSEGENYILLYHYFEWKAVNTERAIKVGMLRNAEKFSIRVFFFALALWVFLQIFPATKQETYSPQEIPTYNLVASYSSTKNGGKHEAIFI
ncbi:TPA: hypothetical protein MNA18_005022, partial [Citrobacter freundii]|nr:hypothetical protein [Citrobacter freundii]